ncbi:uncharacterized protein Z518_01534 [Rhinocladiella mackenziei CBS 650.93]|uniref:Rhinocladiella mackenziei CBS 650.93 unplaced genomic scaffold supercont1.1, whole genome shotgun sequence n=1 Tax=Rhinocladiella mackenziei CBS 650.93 TaxID=1442369 RepID=A0A0D2J417_9EURO|nr:uncharacterized protein Z518_01534 [Rhinocladiella mackenziei CBS 650.93]KIX10451.1 hypothetical protein Z518_01534 [Rhinocladiella mackenziei CBS 650.93]
MLILQLFIYPVKSLPPVQVSSVELTNEGIRFDRSFVLVNPPKDDTRLAKFLTIKKHFKLTLFKPVIDDSWTKLTIHHIHADPPSSITIPLTPSPLSLLLNRTFEVSIFGTTAIGIDLGDEPAAFFSRHLQQDVRLLTIGGTGRREIPGAAYIPSQRSALSLAVREGLQPQRIRFADAAPLLITSTASEENARSRLPKDYQDEDIILRFRPNIHVDVKGQLPPYDEDNWSSLLVRSQSDEAQEVTIKCIFRTVRCLSLNADPETGEMIRRDRQLYGLLASDRRVNDKFPHKPVFGQYAFAGPSGAILRTGDQVYVTERVQRT